MRISRRKKKPQPKKRFFYNERINALEILVLDEEGTSLGIMKTDDATKLAKEKDLDLILINPKSDPPVARFGDFGQFKYQKEKEERKKRANTHVTELKGVRLSMRIGPHDIEIRRKQTIKFLNNGDKVKVEIILRGRENKQVGLGFEVMDKFVKSIEELEVIRVEQPTEKQGNKITTIIAKS